MAEKQTASTPKGKDIQIRPAGQSALFEVCFTSGGQKPKEFDGVFTDEGSAKQAIARYLARKGG